MRPNAIGLPLALLLAACATPPDASLAAGPVDPVVAEGHMLAQVHCAECHAIGPTGASKHPEAIAFRRLHELYDVEGIEESLAEGIVVGHPAMPEFRFRPEDAHALTVYLMSVQGK